MTHVTGYVLLMLWANLSMEESDAVSWELGPWTGHVIHGSGGLVSRLDFTSGVRPTCPECQRLVWLATGERELGDGL
jgi:hypothetical protein